MSKHTSKLKLAGRSFVFVITVKRPDGGPEQEHDQEKNGRRRIGIHPVMAGMAYAKVQGVSGLMSGRVHPANCIPSTDVEGSVNRHTFRR